MWSRCFRRWGVAELVLSNEQIERYARHIAMKEVGVKGQKKLLAAKVLIIGAGGLGSPAAMYLAAAGMGTIGIADSDVVDLSNLQRQILHRTADVGRPKVESARETLSRLNPEVQVKRLLAAGKRLPDMYLCCGTEDFLLEANRAMHRFLQDQGVAHEYHEAPGQHDMAFWSEHIVKIVRWMFA